MNLLVQSVDMRGGYTSREAWDTDVIDEDTGETVGFVRSERSPASRYISLFGGKYDGIFQTPEQCSAFAKGVEAVLNHMASEQCSAFAKGVEAMLHDLTSVDEEENEASKAA